jgi:hypothetical protein
MVPVQVSRHAGISASPAVTNCAKLGETTPSCAIGHRAAQQKRPSEGGLSVALIGAGSIRLRSVNAAREKCDGRPRLHRINSGEQKVAKF